MLSTKLGLSISLLENAITQFNIFPQLQLRLSQPVYISYYEFPIRSNSSGIVR